MKVRLSAAVTIGRKEYLEEIVLVFEKYPEALAEVKLGSPKPLLGALTTWYMTPCYIHRECDKHNSTNSAAFVAFGSRSAIRKLPGFWVVI